jgi:hypothetical protein
MNEAVGEYQQALALEPNNPELLGNLVRARVRRGDADEQLQPLLEELVLKETRPQWREWAERELATRKQSPPSPGPTTQPF